ncbi:DUF2637 domain-containing protein [Streptomyces sp. SL13]|uniref:DUF2637 domain-containing protein n=1 Tax=Streptantibioticus silvisoli TaxID=2705255 RepID=A0AA90H579_9ACTN|nr:DUF2637 domain-containing protein [Streptantibioticus silvisoli]MDI5971476.1 DUF2637 domain-containing protein [Streptantibioticus silvisoli]
MTKPEAERTAVIVAGVVIVVLTAAAFWLSYAHLADVARNNGLGISTARHWAWPATLDLFIIAGEVLMFLAALRNKVDPWAIGLTSAGSLGSIGLNVAGVGTGQPVLHYVVAAVPPSAALLAFGALMRQVHGLVARTAPAPEPESVPVEETAEQITVERIPNPEPELPGPAPEPVTEPAPAASTSGLRPALPAVPSALVDHARKVADAHRTATGADIDAATLRARLGVPPILADAIAAQLA